MLNLVSTSDSIEIATTGTQNIGVSASFFTYNLAAGTVTPGNQNTLISTATTTTVVSAPASGSYIGVHYISIFNQSASTSEGITVKLVNASLLINILSLTLQPLYTLIYEKGTGWYQLDASGGRIETPLAGRFLKYNTILNGTTTFTAGASTNTIKARLQGGGGAGGGATGFAGEFAGLGYALGCGVADGEETKSNIEQRTSNIEHRSEEFRRLSGLGASAGEFKFRIRTV